MRSQQKHHRWNLLFLLFALLLLTPSCMRTLLVKSEEIPEMQGGSALKALTPAKFAILDFEDERPLDEKDFLGIYRLHFKVKIDRDVAEVVRDKISEELRRNGHEIVNSSNTDHPDFMISGKINEYICLGRDVSISTLEVRGELKATVSVKTGSDSKEIFSKQCIGFSDLRGSFVPPDRLVEVCKMSLVNMVRDFTTDPDFIESIKTLQHRP